MSVSYTHLDVYKRQGLGSAKTNSKFVLPSVWSENVKCCGDESDYEREKELEWFKLNRGYGELIEKMNIKRIMINNVDLPCAVVNNDNDYIDDNNIHSPVVKVSVLVTADDYSDEKLKDVIVITNTDGDLTKNTNADLIYDIVIMGGNPRYYYYGTMEHIHFYGYNTKDSHMLCINKIEQCYLQKRLIFDDGV